jgi:membrane protease YdiL (CAAX protease family)
LDRVEGVTTTLTTQGADRLFFMEIETSDYAVGGFVAVAGLISLAVLFRLFQKHIDGRPLLEYERRRPVPWNLLAPLVMLAPLLLAWGSMLLGKPPEDPSLELLAAASSSVAGAAGSPPAAWLGSYVATPTLHELVVKADDAKLLAAQIWAQSLLTITLALGCYVVLTLAFGATREDLGLPASWRQLGRDVLIGATACAASIVPIYIIMYLLSVIFEPQEGHPLIEELMVNHSVSMMLAAAATAVVAAPFYEEAAFRLAFQGWLEKWTAAGRMLTVPIPEQASSVERAPFESAQNPETEVLPIAELVVEQPPSWAPVLISSVLFGLAHLGHGVSPLPLVLLGGVMGYLYRQTHRIVPSMACHMLFNGFTFVMLGLKFALSP